jgi:hypothetical protein
MKPSGRSGTRNARTGGSAPAPASSAQPEPMCGAPNSGRAVPVGVPKVRSHRAPKIRGPPSH